MRISNISLFSEDLLKILTKTVDGVAALIWIILFSIKAAKPNVFGAGEFDGWVYILFSFVIILMLVRLRIDQDEKIIFNAGSFLSVSVFSLIFITR